MKRHFDSRARKACLGLLLGGAVACSSEDRETGGAVAVQISGEAAATDGFLYPDGSEVTFADGWALRFTHLLVTVADVSLSEDPDRAPADQSQHGVRVAREAGPWAVDLAVPGSLAAVGGEGSALPLTRIPSKNEDHGRAFEADRRYAFGYRFARASEDATALNFAGDAATEALYARMVERGDAVLYAGTASFRGEDCATSDPDYDFDAFPTEVPFELGFATPSTYVNCQNQENQGDPFEGEAYQRGIAVLPNRDAIAQITLHLEHPFFSDTVHDSDVYFDQFAARLPAADATLVQGDLVGVDPTAFTDSHERALPWRVCPHGEAVTLPAGKQRSFGVGHVLVDPSGDPKTAFRDYADFVAYVQSTQGHLNGGEGLCYVERDYASPE